MSRPVNELGGVGWQVSAAAQGWAGHQSGAAEQWSWASLVLLSQARFYLLPSSPPHPMAGGGGREGLCGVLLPLRLKHDNDNV